MVKQRRFGDRKDASKLRKLDAMHCIMPLIFPKRCESEVFIFERIDLTNINLYLKKLNSEKPEYKYSLFHVIIVAILKTIVLRPHLNRFIANQNIYQRNDLSASFIVKTSLSDDAEEAMAFVHAQENDNLKTIHDKVYEQIVSCRDLSQIDSSQKAMNIISYMPGPVRWIVGCVARYLDRHGWMPQSVIATDPHYASVLLTQLGSIQLKAGYHHLTDWGTNSLFITVGEKKKRPYFDKDGYIDMRSSIDIGFTVDERISDGFYFAKSIRLLKKILENPEILENPLSEKVLF